METTLRLTSLFAVAAISLAAPASAATIGFDALSGTVGSFTEGGFTFNVSTTGDSGVVAVFDTTCVGAACNGDEDLVPTSGDGNVSGNVLIIQNDEAPVPNDDAGGGDIFLTLVDGPSFRWLGASAVDDGMFEFLDADGSSLGSIFLTGEGETGMTTFLSSVIGIGDTITLRYSGSGGIDSLVFGSVPIPASLPLFLAALFGLGFLARRRVV